MEREEGIYILYEEGGEGEIPVGSPGRKSALLAWKVCCTCHSTFSPWQAFRERISLHSVPTRTVNEGIPATVRRSMIVFSMRTHFASLHFCFSGFLSRNNSSTPRFQSSTIIGMIGPTLYLKCIHTRTRSAQRAQRMRNGLSECAQRSTRGVVRLARW